LEDIAILTLEQITFTGCESKEWGCLGEVWIDPDTDFLDKALESQQALPMWGKKRLT
jgi:hypothetical protein